MVAINGLIWYIYYVSPTHPSLYRDDGSLTIGMCDNNTHIIYINNQLNEYMTWKVLVHELTHASLYSYGIDLDKCCHEELIADYMSTHGAEIIDLARKIIKGY